VKVVATQLPGADAATLRSAVDQLKERLTSAVIVLASVGEDARIVLVAGVTSDLVTRIKAGEIVGEVAKQVGGRGGGRADFAQAGGSDVGALEAALASVVPRLRETLNR
jgi:alanyl-tRNA synthetase